jgi:hypothetical protein
VNKIFASKLVEAANNIRELASDESEQINRGVPTGLVLEMASSAYKYAQADLDNAAFRAAKTAIIRPYYESGDRDIRGRDTVTSTFQSYFAGMPSEAVLNEKKLRSWATEEPEDADAEPAEAVS